MKNSARHIHMLGATGQIRTAVFEEREHVVVPVVALVEGVLFAANASLPELVLADEFAKTPQGWDGRPVLPDHPATMGDRTSANDPRTLETQAFGRLFNTRVEGKKLVTEAWLDTTRAEKIEGARRVLERIKNGELLEVSVGVFVIAEQKSGTFGGKQYGAVWHELVPDHLAMFASDRIVGACSNEMGCGAPRVARVHVFTNGGLRELKEEEMAVEDKKTWREKIAGFFRASADSVSDIDLRGLLDAALRAEVPGYMGIDSVFPDEGQAVYAAQPGDSYQLFRCSYTMNDDGTVKLGGDSVEVKPVTTFEVVNAAGKKGVYEKNGKYCHMTPDGKEMCHDTQGEADSMLKTYKAAASAGCGCGGAKKESPQETVTMEKKERIAAIIASGKTCFTKDDAAVLEGLTDERIKALEEHIKKEPEVPVKEELTEEQVLAKFPSINEAVIAQKRAAAERRTVLLKTLADSKQDVYTEDELKALPSDTLERLAKLAAKTAIPVIDQSGRGAPRSAENANDEIPKPPDMRERILAARKTA